MNKSRRTYVTILGEEGLHLDLLQLWHLNANPKTIGMTIFVTKVSEHNIH